MEALVKEAVDAGVDRKEAVVSVVVSVVLQGVDTVVVVPETVHAAVVPMVA